MDEKDRKILELADERIALRKKLSNMNTDEFEKILDSCCMKPGLPYSKTAPIPYGMWPEAAERAAIRGE